MLKRILLPVLISLSPMFVMVQAFVPTPAVEIVVHNAPGGGSDVLARFVSLLLEREKLLPVRNQVHNRTGGGGLRRWRISPRNAAMRILSHF